MRSAASAYRLATQDIVRAKNPLKAVLRSRGIVADKSIYATAARTNWLKQLPFGHRQLGEWLGRELDELTPLRDDAEEWLLKESHRIIRKLMTGPGIGPIRSGGRIFGRTMRSTRPMSALDSSGIAPSRRD